MEVIIMLTHLCHTYLVRMAQLLPTGDHVDEPEDFQILNGFRVRILPVLGEYPWPLVDQPPSH